MNPDSLVKFLSKGYLQLGTYIFRQVDPTRNLYSNRIHKRWWGAMATIYLEPDCLWMQAGSFNALFFMSYHAWDQYWANWDGPKACFINKMCYGICQASQDICHALNYWQESLDWLKFLGQSRGKEKLNHLFKYWQMFDNIGDLSALLPLGDLVEGNVLNMPDASEWREIVKKGAIKG